LTWSGLRPFLSRCFVRDELRRRFSLKMLLKLASKCWVDGLNEICWCASFVCWPKLFQVLHLLRSFLKCLCEHPRVRLTFWKLMCWICGHPRVRLKFYVRFFFLSWLTPLKLTLKKWIVQDLLTASDDEIFRNFQASWNDWNSFH